MFRG